jgi:thiol-disulfide isomerase/thioredoxin
VTQRPGWVHRTSPAADRRTAPRAPYRPEGSLPPPYRVPASRPRRPGRSRSALASVRGAALATALVATAVGLISGCAGDTSGPGGAPGNESRFVAGDGTTQVIEPPERRPAPEVAGTTLDDRAYRLADHRGKTVVVNFWASWCAPCRAEAPALREVYQRHKGDGVEFLGIAVKDGRAGAKAFLRNIEPGYPSLYDQPGELALAFRDTVPPNAIPSTIIIDRKARVAARVIGPVTHSALERLVGRIAAERA